MDKLSMCRICLVEDVKMYSLISVNLQELYERLTEKPFVTKDKKPVQVCYLCRARLQNCHRLQVACVKSEEFFNKVIADRELNDMKLQDLNTLRTVHPLILISCVPSTRKDPEDDKIDKNNDFKFEPLEITSDVQVKLELFEDDSFLNAAADIKLEGTVTNEVNSVEDGDVLDNSHTIEDTELEHDISLTVNKIVPERINLENFKIDEDVYIKSEGTVEEEDISTEDSVMSDNSHTMQNTELEHDIHLKTVKIVLERIDLEQFKSSRFAAKTQESGLPNGNTKPYRCKICEKSFSQRRYLVNHTRIHTGEKPYRCKICERSFSLSSYLVKHTRIHTGEKPYSCKICEKSFSQSRALVNHTRIHTGEKPYRCKICEKSFSQNTSLVNHTRIHTGEKPYRCKICERSFSLSSYLVEHTRIHTSEKPYRCKICKKSFSQSRYLVNHTRIHTGEKPYRCKICEKSFSQGRYLVNHTLNHSAERPYTCDICQKKFSTKINLLKHIYRHKKKPLMKIAKGEKKKN